MEFKIMFLTDDDILKLSKLSRLKISNEEKKYLLEDLNNIFNMINDIKELNITNTDSCTHPYDLSQRLREDIVIEIKNKDELQKNAPMVEKGFYIVPKVIE